MTDDQTAAPAAKAATSADVAPSKQRDMIVALLAKAPKAKQKWYMLAREWFDKWCAYVGHSESGEEAAVDPNAESPGPIDNSTLADESYPQALIKYGTSDMHKIHKEAWDLLVSWYGVKDGSTYERDVIQEDEDEPAQVDLYPKFFRVWVADPETGKGKEYKEVKMASNATLTNVVEHMRSVLCPNDEGEMNAEDWRLSQKFTPEPTTSTNPFVTDAAPQEEEDDGDTKEENDQKTSGDAAPECPKFWTPIHSTDLSSVLSDIPNWGHFVELLTEQRLPAADEKTPGKFPRDYEWDFKNIRPGDVIDVQDRQRKWYQGRVQYVKDNCVKMHYIGWAEKWNEEVEHDPDRLRPIHTITHKPHKPLVPAIKSYGGYSGWSMRAMDDVAGKPKVTGLVGLCNLGNTCFMNSVLQCMFQTEWMRKYFISGKYKKDINLDNPLGWKGNVANSWGSLLDRVFNNKFKTVAPKKFKKAIGKVAPRFADYNQQDSQEFLTFLLDGLHEDLNRIKSKPATEKPDSDGTVPDQKIADASWEVFRKRNDSVVVDSLYGLLKNEVVCPECGTKSIVFDPFTFLQLPLPVDNDRTIHFTFVPADGTKPSRQSVTLSGSEFIRTFKQHVSKEVGVPLESLDFKEVYTAKWYQPFTRFSDIETLISLKENESFFVYEKDKHSEEEAEVFKKYKHTLDTVREFALGDPVYVNHHDKKWYRAKVVRVQKPKPVVALDEEDGNATNDADKSEATKPAQPIIYTVKFNNNVMEDHKGPRNLRYNQGHAPRVDACILHIKASEYNSTYERTEPFGMPQHFYMPTKDCTNAEMLKLLEAKIAPYVNEQAKGSGDKIYEIHRKNLSNDGDTTKILDDDRPFPFDKFVHWGALPEIHIKWHKPQYYNESVDTDPPPREEHQIAAKDQALHITDCVERFCETEVLDDMNMVYCRKCKEHRNSKKTTSVWKYPETLIIHFKRFSYGGNFADKVKTPVDFPLVGLDLSKWMVDQTALKGDEQSGIFDCYGVSNHSGFLAGGHYTAYVRSLENGKWYEMDDSSVSEVRDHHQIPSKRAYLTFWRRRKMGEEAPKNPLTARPAGAANQQQNPGGQLTAAALEAHAADDPPPGYASLGASGGAGSASGNVGSDGPMDQLAGAGGDQINSAAAEAESQPPNPAADGLLRNL